MARVTSKIVLVLCFGCIVASCNDEREITSSGDSDKNGQVVSTSDNATTNSTEDTRILKKLSNDDESLSAEELRIEAKLKAEAEERALQFKSLAAQVAKREKQTQQERELRLTKMKSKLKIDGSDQSMTGSVGDESN